MSAFDYVCVTFEFDAKLGERLLHALTLSLPHEAVVDVDRNHLILVESFVEESCAHRGVHTSTQQHLDKQGQIKTVAPTKVPGFSAVHMSTV